MSDPQLYKDETGKLYVRDLQGNYYPYTPQLRHKTWRALAFTVIIAALGPLGWIWYWQWRAFNPTGSIINEITQRTLSGTTQPIGITVDNSFIAYKFSGYFWLPYQTSALGNFMYLHYAFLIAWVFSMVAMFLVIRWRWIE